MQAARAATGFRTVNTPLAFGVSTPTRFSLKGKQRSGSQTKQRTGRPLLFPPPLIAQKHKLAQVHCQQPIAIRQRPILMLSSLR